MTAYLQEACRALLEFLCALTGHARGCALLNRGLTGRLYTWAMTPRLADLLMASLEADEEDEEDDFPSALPDGLGVACLACHRAFDGELISCPRNDCPVMGLPQC